ncbi:MAG: prepilin-type N-terminal cleavage/methylation domain-containing protein [Parcubacteria group bacterium]|nr:prepilin-type N-terminal cleavage/methylation domain-containing protein [Parcubacteria group bacterium]
MKSPRHCILRGFTLIEIVITVGIFLIVMGIGLFVGLDFYRGSALTAERDTVVSILRSARSDAFNNLHELPHGIFIDADRYILFSGASYASRDPQFDEVIFKSPAVDASGTQEIVFQQLSATTGASGTIILSYDTRSVTIEVNGEGRINW